MPANAIATRLVDIVLPIEDMADRLVQLANGRSPQGGLAEHKLENKTQEIDEAKLVITRILEKQLGHDFSGYKGARPSSGGCSGGCRSRNSTNWRATSNGCVPTPTKLPRYSVTC